MKAFARATSPEFRVMMAPARAYELLASQPAAAGPFAAFGRPALVALVVGTATAIAATGRVTLSLVLSGTICWSFVPALQAATAALFMRSPRRRDLRIGRRLQLWFMGHGPWSLWLLAAAAALAFAPPTRRIEWPLIGSALVPAVWTGRIATAFCRTVLHDTRAQARRRIAIHQAVTWTLVLGYIAVAGAAWPRILAVIGR